LRKCPTDYAGIGTVSNIASRIVMTPSRGKFSSVLGLTKVMEAVKVEPVGEFKLKGIRRPLAAYNVIAAKSAD
jgi:adenylate cyclase